MSGTSCDGISAALVQFPQRSCRVLASRTVPYPSVVRDVLQQAHALTAPELSQLNMCIGEWFAFAALDLLRRQRIATKRVAVIGSHGHTVYHGPRDVVPCTLQVGEPAVIAERSGLPVVANFRMRDLAAGGEGAPLIPAFDAYLFGGGLPRALQNIGGIANVTLVGRGIRLTAFDTGPGTCLMDAVARRLSHGTSRYDPRGRFAQRGRIDHRAITQLLAHPYFHRPPPKSTGPELFNEQWLTATLGARWMRRLHDALATVTYLTAVSIAESSRRFLPVQPREVIVSGGGVRNDTLMGHLRHLLHPVPVRSIERYGLPAQAKEPAAFAYLALCALQGKINHAPSTTGASHPRILGTIVPAQPTR